VAAVEQSAKKPGTMAGTSGGKTDMPPGGTESGIFLTAFTIGIAAFFNPCGFPMLPAFISYSLSRGTSAGSAWVRSLQGLLVAGTTSAGFLTVFGGFGLIFSSVGMRLMKYMPWLAVLIGAILILLGIWMLFRQTLPLTLWLESLAARVGSYGRGQGGVTQGIRFYYFYGIAYAITSIGCTIPIFLAYVVTQRLETFWGEMLKFVSYAGGMSLMMLVLAVALAYSQGGFRKSSLQQVTMTAVALLLAIFVAVQFWQPQVMAEALISWQLQWNSSDQSVLRVFAVIPQSLAAMLSGTNEKVVPAFAAALALMLFFWARGWMRLFHLANALILMGAGAYLIWYQWYSGLLRF
jgi:cytochrome c biogenesis protein CcdA